MHRADIYIYVVYISSVVQDKEPRGIIPLENLSIREVEDKKPVSTARCLLLSRHRAAVGLAFYSRYIN